jgi:hypothetical protein
MYGTAQSLILSCFSTPLSTLWDRAGPSLRAQLDTQAITATDAPLDLSRIRVGDLQRGGAAPSSCVLYAPSSAPETTVMLTSSADGWYTLVDVLAKGPPGRHVMVRSILGAEQLHHLNVWMGGKEVRSVVVHQDPRWTFFEVGSALEFEDTARYLRRLKRERLDRNLLLRYLGAMGWNTGDPRFWETRQDARHVEEQFGRR